MRNSLTAVMDVATNKVEKFSYKPWGMRRKPVNWSENFVTDYTSRFSRGYCMHEHSSVYGDDGITMGHFSNVNINDEVVGDFSKFVQTEHRVTYMHEYGHLYQGCNYGPLYLPYIGVQSILSAANKEVDHMRQWYEVEASYYGKRFFVRKYGPQVWTDLMEIYNPTSK